MATRGLVSVVIPTHNRAHTLRPAVLSALGQDDVDVEVLVCDDGSTDGSRSIVEALGDKRVQWLSGPRSGGPSVPRNRGVDAAKGEWVAFLDSDDVWYQGKLGAQLAALAADSAQACATNAIRLV